MEIIKLERKEINKIRPWLQKACPSYMGYKVKLVFTDKTIDCTSHWDGGSRNYFTVVSASGEQRVLPQSGTMFDKIAVPQVEITPDVAVIEHSIFCGTDVGIRIYFHPSLKPQWITVN